MNVTNGDTADLRAEIARLRIPIFQLAARVDVHPGRMSRYLNERIPIPKNVARRIWLTLEEERTHQEGQRNDRE